MGELLSDWNFQPVLWLYPGLGGKEDPETSDASEETPWLRVEQVE